MKMNQQMLDDEIALIIPEEGISEKGETKEGGQESEFHNALDNRGNSARIVGSRYGEFLHTGGLHTPVAPAGDHCRPDPRDPGAQPSRLIRS